MQKEKQLPESNVWVFLGPSLSRHRAETILAANYAPPIKRGDIPKAVQQGARAIAIIDGSFYRTFSVSPFEILTALRQGVKIYGASSMGALKAVECEPFGMIGVGKIFRWYHSGKIEAEDEVAIVFDAESLQALSVPLVNMRHAFSLAENQCILSKIEKNFLLRIAKKIYFPERSYESVFARAKAKGFSSEKIKRLGVFVNRDLCDLKALDAIACLEMIRDDLSENK
jgi:TfuA protein